MVHEIFKVSFHSCKFASTAKVAISQLEDNTALKLLKLLSGHNFRSVVNSLSVRLPPSSVSFHSTAFTVNPPITFHRTCSLGACASFNSYALITD